MTGGNGHTAARSNEWETFKSFVPDVENRVINRNDIWTVTVDYFGPIVISLGKDNQTKEGVVCDCPQTWDFYDQEEAFRFVASQMRSNSFSFINRVEIQKNSAWDDDEDETADDE